MTIVERGMQPLEVTNVKSYQVEKLHFRFDHFGWMNVFLDDMGPRGPSNYGCGEIAIHSDWGSWAYTWTGMAEGESLKSFLCKAENDYIARKLLTGATEEWDPEATKAALRKYIEDTYEEGEEVPLESWSRTKRVTTRAALLDYLEHCDWDSGLTLWVERMHDTLHAVLNEPWEHVVNKPTVEYTVLTEGLLPALKNYLREQAKPKLEAAP